MNDQRTEDETLADLTAALKEQVAALDAEIATVEASLTSLRSRRARYVKVMRVASGEKPSAKSSGKSSGKHSLISSERVDRLLDWLRENVDGKTFSQTEIANAPGQSIPAGSLQPAIAALRDRGAIVLDHVGPSNRKNYRLAER